MLNLYNIKSKRWILISSKTILGKKALCGTKNLDWRILIVLKEKAQLYVDGAGLTPPQKEEKPMNYFPKNAYWRPLVLNAEIVDKTTNPSLKIFTSHLLRKTKQGLFWFKKPICFIIPMFTATYKNMKKFVSEIFKRTRSRKPYAEEASKI